MATINAPCFPLAGFVVLSDTCYGHQASRLTTSITVGVSGASYEVCRAITLTVLLVTDVLLHLAVEVITGFLDCTTKVIPTSL